MLKLTDPGDAAFDAHAEAAMRHRSVASQVEIPLESFLREVMFPDSLTQEIEIVQALASADDLAVPFGRQHVHTQRLLRLFRVRLHVEGLDGPRVVGDADRPVE